MFRQTAEDQAKTVLRFLKALSKNEKSAANKRTLLRASDKIKREKRLKSKEFSQVYEMIFGVGPEVKNHRPEQVEKVIKEHNYRCLFNR